MRQTQLALTLTGMFLSLSTGAQNIPDAGALMRQMEQNTRQSQMQQAMSKRDLLPPALVLSDATLITVQRFRFNGAKLLGNDQLQAVGAAFTNRPLNSHDLQQLLHAITESYRQAGWLVRAYIPRQDFNNEELTIQIIETIPPSKSGQ